MLYGSGDHRDPRAGSMLGALLESLATLCVMTDACGPSSSSAMPCSTPRWTSTRFACRREALKGDRAGQRSYRINKQWRISFVWTDAGPDDVTIEDSH